MIELRPEQVKMARHALGLSDQRGRWRKSYRNHYCVGFGAKSWWLWQLMVAKGLAIYRPARKGGSVEWSGDFFHLTRLGAKTVLRKNERLCSEDFPQ